MKTTRNTIKNIAAAILLSPGMMSVANGQVPVKKKTVRLHGVLNNFNNQVMIEDMSAYQYLFPPDAGRVVVADETGHFSIQMTVDSPGYYRLGRNILYLSPGDDMEVMIDKGDPAMAGFTGKGSAANLYLRKTPFPKGGSFLEAGKNLRPTPQATLDEIKALGTARQKTLDTLRQVSAAFRRLETARIKADMINSFHAVNSYAPRRGGDTTKIFLQEFNALAASSEARYGGEIKDASYMQLVVYRDIADKLMGPGDNAGMVQQVKDWYASSDLMQEMQKVSDKSRLASYREPISKIQSAGYRNALNKSLDNLLKFGKGDPAHDFMATDTNGNKVLLSSLKGKVIYVDLWATWCGPCMGEMPYFEKLKEKYKGNPDVVFLSLSIDDSGDMWKRSIARRKADGYQWLINRDRLSDYNIVGIPRTLLIDKHFTIVDMNGALPSSAQAEKSIDALLK